MATNLTYNGVKLLNVQTLEFTQIPQREESGTDQIFQRFRIRVRSFISADAWARNYLAGTTGKAPIAGAVQIPNATALDTTQQLEVKLRAYLGQDRQQLLYTMEGVTMIQSDSTMDCDNGPKVSELSVVHVTPKTLRIDFAIETALILCPDFTPSTGYPSPTGPDSPLISNRWACIDDVNENWQTTRIWRGIMRIDNNRGGAVEFNPHRFRDLIVPPLAKGWRRIGMNFAGDPDNLTLAYTITDREMVGASPPWPAATMDYHHTETCGVGASGSGVASVPFGIGTATVRLTGARGADKRAMFAWAARIISNRLQTNSQKNFRLLELSLADHGGADINMVEMNAKIAHTPPKSTDSVTQFNWLGMVVLGSIGTPIQGLPPLINAEEQEIEYDPDVAYWLGPYGTATLATLFACYLQTPCGQDHALVRAESDDSEGVENENTEDDSEPPSATYSNVQIDINSELANAPLFSDANEEALYQFYQIDSEYRTPHNRVVLPISASNSTSDSEEGPQPTVKVCDMAPATCYRTVRIHGERLSEWPLMIAPVDFEDSNGIKHFLLEPISTPKGSVLTADGQTSYFCCDQELHYVLERPPESDEPLPVGVLPWDTLTPQENRMPPEAFAAPDDEGYGIL